MAELPVERSYGWGEAMAGINFVHGAAFQPIVSTISNCQGFFSIFDLYVTLYFIRTGTKHSNCTCHIKKEQKSPEKLNLLYT